MSTEWTLLTPFLCVDVGCKGRRKNLCCNSKKHKLKHNFSFFFFLNILLHSYHVHVIGSLFLLKHPIQMSNDTSCKQYWTLITNKYHVKLKTHKNGKFERKKKQTNKSRTQNCRSNKISISKRSFYGKCIWRGVN